MSVRKVKKSANWCQIPAPLVSVSLNADDRGDYSTWNQLIPANLKESVRLEDVNTDLCYWSCSEPLSGPRAVWLHPALCRPRRRFVSLRWLVWAELILRSCGLNPGFTCVTFCVHTFQMSWSVDLINSNLSLPAKLSFQPHFLQRARPNTRKPLFGARFEKQWRNASLWPMTRQRCDQYSNDVSLFGHVPAPSSSTPVPRELQSPRTPGEGALRGDRGAIKNRGGRGWDFSLPNPPVPPGAAAFHGPSLPLVC